MNCMLSVKPGKPGNLENMKNIANMANMVNMENKENKENMKIKENMTYDISTYGHQSEKWLKTVLMQSMHRASM